MSTKSEEIQRMWAKCDSCGKETGVEYTSEREEIKVEPDEYPEDWGDSMPFGWVRIYGVYDDDIGFEVCEKCSKDILKKMEYKDYKRIQKGARG